MQKLNFKIPVNASPERVWKILFEQDGCKNWASAMNEGTYFEGTWEEGSIMRFLDAQNNGMYNRVDRNIPNRELQMTQLGWIINGEVSPQDWQDSTISYILEPSQEGTLLRGEVNSLDEFVDFFNSKYPENFKKIKALAEAPNLNTD